MGGSWTKRPALKKTGCNQSATGFFDFWQTRQLATGLITIDRNWQLQSSCDQLQSSPVASLCTSCQLDFETLLMSFAQKQQCHPNAVLIRLQVACLESYKTLVSTVKYNIGFMLTDSGVSLTLSLSDSELVLQKVKMVLHVDLVRFPHPRT